MTLAAAILAIGSWAPVFGAPRETDLVAVTADVAFLRQYNGVLHLGIVLHNSGTANAHSSQAIDYSQIVIIDAKANKKYFALKDANGHFLAGPISDWNGGGRWYPTLAPGSDTIIWALFDAVPGANVSVQGPFFHNFDNVAVASAAPSSAELASAVPPLRASLVSANRAEGQLKVQLKIVNPTKYRVKSGGSTVQYSEVYALDPQGKRNYPLLKDTQGLFIATPMSDKNNGGRWFLSYVQPNGQVFVDLTFQAPPDSVNTVDIVFPWFPPFEAVAITGQGGAAASGVAVAGRSADLERALKDLAAVVTPQDIKVNLSADLLFDFDKADLKPAAEPELMKVATVLKSYPNAKVLIEGHTDGKGSDSYNQPLSERRATMVAQWLISRAGVNPANLQTRGFGKTRPVAPNVNPDGSDNPDGRAKNRRVEITVTKN